ncbi:ABC transporter ATP-binding protein [Enterococcus casseliflavus]|uniref:ABC transporter ATP-binding protein n=1 Tax=Enterococcus casseliflavus TaxID=37734 RepID=UPI00232D4467|nr:ABC transporter ATP-binding protein [Enterococcus casseliflavus]MDB1694557.1 ABC transporter ATP-binding protein [Enterococcus casseliflavus]MDB1697991.1 ABC transporter ATP-binding protein [Enterococcus casseliflavus]MDB1702857.1 ABC transporter ATP-binding protein [Enterococcus casseliflavus]MDB1704146.1 ABC transporter ATP-binding protein [Enterococcus casseliflavus]
MEKIIQANELTKVYGKANEKQTEALKGISFDIEKGEFIGIMGASGSGKSTLLNILSTLDHPTKGTIRINNSDITKLKGDALADFRSREIGFIFQDFNLLENLTASENIAVPLSLQGVKPKIIQQRIKQVAERLSITHILDKYPAAISGGQKQRVAAARALITEPTILFADEPTGALDSKSAKDLLNMMDDLNTNDQVSILLVTHDPLSASYCQRILFIKDGKIHQEVKREDQSREAFYRQILVILGNLEQ